ncbi:H-type small acid-soluble spore protein [Paludifilum halophilum]|uniref:H-type small acid-soluble spore protein n=1 Tax=Paludifilum halophilum TaxID=1642702 RepID=A0A235BBZ5_9BACL|nr:H-type small acid-soluble spore protein [Paludifilum halophilum]OYD09810.1 H-type small acid-soluble spore protein [Paludifilum halophilum]
MDILRAKQILESPNKVDVRYEGVPIWIQNVDEEGETARVYTSANPDDEKVVPVRQLEEF